MGGFWSAETRQHLDLSWPFFLFGFAASFVVDMNQTNVSICVNVADVAWVLSKFLPHLFLKPMGFFKCVIVMESHPERCLCQVVRGQLVILVG